MIGLIKSVIGQLSVEPIQISVFNFGYKFAQQGIHIKLTSGVGLDKQHTVLLGRRQFDLAVTGPVDLAEIAFMQNADQFVRGGICPVTERTHKAGGFPALRRRDL